ncbi:hypothetical protein D3C87_2078560 [compost metagenome]
MAEEVVELHQAFDDVHVGRSAMQQELVEAREQILELMPDLLPAAAFPEVAELLEEIKR